MRKKCVSLVSIVVRILSFLIAVFLTTFLVYVVWSMNQPANWWRLFPEGTRIVLQSDSHQGFFRRKGVAVVVVQIPESRIQEFGERLKARDFSRISPVGPGRDLLSSVEEIGHILDSPNTMFNYEDGAIALVEEPFSDCSAAIYDLDTGLFCHIEYDE